MLYRWLARVALGILCVFSYSVMCADETISVNEEGSEESAVFSERMAAIQELSDAICDLTVEGAHSPGLAGSLYNQRGMEYLFLGRIGLALKDFDHVLSQREWSEDSPATEWVALWGALFCHAFLSHIDEVQDYAARIRARLEQWPCCESLSFTDQVLSCLNKMKGNQLHAAKFAYPEEHVTRAECRDRVLRISEKMRDLAGMIPLLPLRVLVLPVIDGLQRKSYRCCDEGNHWTECLGPIADVWLKIEECQDQLVELFKKGIRIDKFLME